MKAAFADSFFFLAMLNVRDSCHREAVAWSESFAGRILTTHWVLVEVGDAFSKSTDRDRFIDLLQLIEDDERIEVVPASAASFECGVELFARRPDKSWSLTDCISFVVMQQQGITEALTGDHHFEQAGLVALLRDNE